MKQGAIAVSAALVVATGLTPPTHAGDSPYPQFTSVVWRGDLITDQPDAAAFGPYEHVVLNDNGDVAVSMGFTGPGLDPFLDRGIISVNGSNIRTLARSGRFLGDPADQFAFDGVAGVPSSINITADGGVVATVHAEGPTLTDFNRRMIVRGSAMPLEVVAQQQTPLPNGQNTFAFEERLVSNASGRVAFLGSVSGFPEALFVADSSGVRLAASIGQQLTARPGYRIVDVANPVIADTGDVYFHGSARFTSTGMPELFGVWKAGANEPTPIAVASQPAPGVVGGTFNSTFAPSVSSSGQHIAFAASAEVGPNDVAGIWRRTGEALELVHSSEMDISGQPAGTRFIGYGANVSLNNRGDISFRGHIEGGGFGLFTHQDDKLHTIFTAGQQALNADPTVTVAFRSESSGTMNDLGQVVIPVHLFDDGAPTGIGALYAWDPTIGLIELLRDGGQISVDGQLKTVASFEFEMGQRVFGLGGELPGGTGGLSSGFNNHGQLALGIEFTDNTGGVFIIQVPAPTTAAALALSLGLLATRRRRR